MPEKFNIKTASKVECLAKANKMLNLGIKSEATAKEMIDGQDKDTKMRQVDFALNLACKVELAAFDGRQ
ncbi:MAG: hypothetical protein FVQ79_13440 [Planctomycetes bacterium]|nr:hypothetical protein [Planctomycetota bacterium]